MVKDEAQYDVVLKMVLWDESREAILRRLEVNGVSDERAREIYRVARAERVKLLRGDGMKVLGLGLGSFVLGVLVYCVFDLDQLNAAYFGDGVNGTAVLPWLLGFVCALFGAFGIWKTVQGVTEICFAPMKTGSIADR